jgi:hypothetical protein
VLAAALNASTSPGALAAAAAVAGARLTGALGSPWAAVHVLCTHDAPGGLELLRQTQAARFRAALVAMHVADTLLVAAYLAMLAAWHFVLLLPYSRQTEREAAQVAVLLGFVPPAVSLKRLVGLHARALAWAPPPREGVRGRPGRRQDSSG